LQKIVLWKSSVSGLILTFRSALLKQVMVKIFGIKLLDQNNFLALHDKLAEKNPQHFINLKSKFKNLTAMQHRFLGELLIKAVAVSRYHLPLNETATDIGKNSKPHFKLHRGLHFNLSHSGQWVVAAFSYKPVGIDIEKVKHVNLGIARRFFAADEITYLQALPENEQMEGFFRLWTLKESYLKALGTGLTRSLSSFMINYEDSKISLSEEGIRIDVSLDHIDIEKNYQLSVCALEPSINKEVEILAVAEILKYFEQQ
jgi:4'-phosphopantetheinyl transferase